MDTQIRSIVKSIIWRILAFLTTMIVVYIYSKDLKATFTIGIGANLIKMAIYYIHERIWERISWGKIKHPLADIPIQKKLNPEDEEKIIQKLKELGYID